MKHPKSFISLVLAAFVATAHAAAPLPAASSSALPTVGDIPAPLVLAVQTGLKIVQRFPAADGLTGWVLSRGPGQNMVVYSTPKADVVIAGNMLDAKGRNLSQEYLDKYAPKVNYAQYWDKVQASTYFKEGARGAAVTSIIYAIEDPNCPFCNLAWKSLQPYEQKGLQVRWIPVAFEAKDSMNKAAAILEAKDPAKANAAWHARFEQPDPALSNYRPSAAVEAKIKDNLKLMSAMGLGGTPSFLWKDKTGKVSAISGMPSPEQLGALVKSAVKD